MVIRELIIRGSAVNPALHIFAGDPPASGGRLRPTIGGDVPSTKRGPRATRGASAPLVNFASHAAPPPCADFDRLWQYGSGSYPPKLVAWLLAV